MLDTWKLQGLNAFCPTPVSQYDSLIHYIDIERSFKRTVLPLLKCSNERANRHTSVKPNIQIPKKVFVSVS